MSMENALKQLKIDLERLPEGTVLDPWQVDWCNNILKVVQEMIYGSPKPEWHEYLKRLETDMSAVIRRVYPLNNSVYLESIAFQVRMLRS
jgi:hypothetical protein